MVVYYCQVDMKSSGKTSLQVTSHQGYTDIVELLLNAGSNLQLHDEDGDTALHYSAFGYAFIHSFIYLKSTNDKTHCSYSVDRPSKIQSKKSH